jgi:hypothetical protein
MSEDASSGRSVDAGQGWTWIADGFGLFKKAPGMWIALVVVLFVILFVLAFIPLLGMIAMFLLMPVFMGGLILGCRKLQEGGEIEIGQLFEGFKVPQTANLVVLGALTLAGWVVVMVPVIVIVGAGAVFGTLRGDAAGAVTIGGSFLLAWLIALALSILLYMAIWFAPALIVLRGMAPVAAIKESFQGCLRNVVPFLVYGIVLFVLGIVAAIPLGLGWLVLGPVVIASVYTAYVDIYGAA